MELDFFKIESMAKMEECMKNINYKRDYSKMTYGAVEFFNGPY